MTFIYWDLTGGDDGNDGLTIGAPKLSVGNAASAAGELGSVNLLDGTHSLAGNVTSTVSQNVTIQSLSGNPKACIIDGGVSEFRYTLNLTGGGTSQRIGWHNMLITDNLLKTYDVKPTTIHDNIFYRIRTSGSNRYIIEQNSGDPNQTITGNDFIECSLPSTAAAIVFVKGFLGGGYTVFENNNIISTPTLTPLRIVKSTNNVATVITADNNIWYHNQASHVRFVDVGANEIASADNNCFHSIGGGSITNTNADSEVDNVTGDPLFYNLATWDFRMPEHSPARKTGKT